MKSYFPKYCNPQNVYEENVLLIKCVKYFTALPVKIGSRKKRANLDRKYLICPGILIIYKVIVLLYLLKINFTTEHIEEREYLEAAILTFLICIGVTSFVTLCILQYNRMNLFISLLNNIELFDALQRKLYSKYERNMKRRHSSLSTILGFSMFIAQWLFLIYNLIVYWAMYMTLIYTLYVIQYFALILMIYLYISLVCSVTKRFRYISTSLIFISEKQENNCITAKRTSKLRIAALLNLCDLLKEINFSFGAPLCVCIFLIFVWIIVDYFSLIKLLLAVDLEQSAYGWLSMLIATVKQIIIFFMLWTLLFDKCTNEVRITYSKFYGISN